MGFVVNLPFADNTVHSLGDTVGVVIETKVTKQHGTGKDHGTGVGLVLTLDVQANVTATRLENSGVTAHVAARNQTGTTDKSGSDVGQNATVQVRHDHNVELLGPGDSLHGCVVDNHVVDLQSRVVLGGLVEGVAEETIGQLHDVGLVDAGNLLTVVGESKAESELGNALGLSTGDNLQRLDHTLHRLVLKTRVLSLCVFTDNAKVDVLVAGLIAGDVLDQHDRRVDVKLLTQSNVERLVTGALNGGEKNTLQTKLVAAKRCNGLLEQLLRVLVACVHTSDVDLLPLNGNVVGLENSLHGLSNLSTDTVTLIAKKKN